ncbi:AAA family ATPase [Neorhodopirellula pilleata]|uniref:Putative chaperone BssE n=1 Tax=Neorhodopirellula pilleata TaxID=2714738 RepID=A0A5C5ZR87_9BACT|nr:AAA family ATPase [Neorhodopirellula pilleata]TWT89311.1 putative chaperone BssE [Neorhodopirellula pilleata]
MAVRVDVTELNELLAVTPPQQNIMLAGRHGIGKSQTITEFYRRRGMPVVAFFLGQMSDPGDLIGLMHQDETTQRSEFMPPYWWPVDDQPVALFLDELNRARPEILQSVMELALNKTLAGKKLPEGSVIVSAVNEGDEYQLTDLDPALVSRFNLYHFAPTVDDWMRWASEHRIDARVIGFLQKQPHYLDGDSVADPSSAVFSSGLVKTPDRRGWARVSDLIGPLATLTPMHIKMVAGIVGPTAATAFRKSLATPLPVTPDEVLLAWSTHRKTIAKMPLQELLLLNEQILMWLQADKCPVGKQDQARKALLAYLKLLRSRKFDEGVAHFVSMVDKPQYPNAMLFLSESLELTGLVTEYIEGIQIH